MGWERFMRKNNRARRLPASGLAASNTISQPQKRPKGYEKTDFSAFLGLFGAIPLRAFVSHAGD